ncbi:MAG: hypothetical protein NC820_07425 [Candidatus Omnitrophica bacterium]|nr:hypothetical protein [Candidatus Omnitrophota bacterium]
MATKKFILLLIIIITPSLFNLGFAEVFSENYLFLNDLIYSLYQLKMVLKSKIDKTSSNEETMKYLDIAKNNLAKWSNSNNQDIRVSVLGISTLISEIKFYNEKINLIKDSQNKEEEFKKILIQEELAWRKLYKIVNYTFDVIVKKDIIGAERNKEHKKLLENLYNLFGDEFNNYDKLIENKDTNIFFSIPVWLTLQLRWILEKNYETSKNKYPQPYFPPLKEN